MAKKVTAVLLCILLAFSLAACKGNAEETANTVDVSTTKNSTTENTSASTTESTTAEETATTTTTEASTTTTKKETTTAKKANVTTAKETTTKKKTTTTKKQKKTTTTTKKQTTKKQTTTRKTVVSTTKPSYSVNASKSDIKEIYNLVNKERTSNGLKKYAYRNDLQKDADTRAKEIAKEFSHTRPNGTACFTAIKEAGVSYTTAGENIGQTTGSYNDMMTWWMNSKDHKNNILSSKFTGIVVGYYQEGNTKFYVQLFVG